MTESVHATEGARHYHRTRDCRALLSGQELNDWGVAWNDSRYSGHPKQQPVARLSLTDATKADKRPCGTCYPGAAAARWIGSCENSFDHEPVWIEGDMFCVSCRTRYTDEDGEQCSYPTVWPCMSAVVLGLVLRKESP